MCENTDIPEKPRKTGGCRVTDFSVPGMYYEKVYSNSISTTKRLDLFDSFSIRQSCEGMVFKK